MKNQPLAILLVILLFASALVTVWMSSRYYFTLNELQQIQYQFTRINNARNAAQGLANDALEYSKSNKDIDPILQEFDIKPANVPPVAPTPAAAPAPAPGKTPTR